MTLETIQGERFMLTSDQRAVLEALILPALGNNPSTDLIARLANEGIAQRTPTVPRVYVLAQWLVTQALLHETPDVLINLAGAVDNLDGRSTSIFDLVTELKNDPTKWRPGGTQEAVDWALIGDPLDVDDDGGPFLDREAFRQLLPRPGVQAGPNCVVVQGERGSGKTYLSRFCKRLSQQREEFCVGYAALGSSGVQSVGPDTPAIQLAYGLQTEPTKEPRPHEDPHRYAHNLATWITTYTPPQAIPALAILDEFDDTNVPEAVHTFVLEMVRGVQTDPEASARLSVVLLGYDVGRLQDQGLDYELCVLEFVDAGHVEAWFRQRFPQRPDYEYEDAVSLILQRVPDSGTVRMQNLCSRIQLACRGFEEH